MDLVTNGWVHRAIWWAVVIVVIRAEGRGVVGEVKLQMVVVVVIIGIVRIVVVGAMWGWCCGDDGEVIEVVVLDKVGIHNSFFADDLIIVIILIICHPIAVSPPVTG